MIKIITLHQPWASLVALRLKGNETRSWHTKYRGLLAIHAGLRPIKRDKDSPILYTTTWGDGDGFGFEKLNQALSQDLPLGAIVAICELTDCRMMRDQRDRRHLNPGAYIYINQQTPLEIATGDWKEGRYAWKLENVLALPTPIACRGYQGLRNLPDELELAINQQINPGRFGA
jgi:activating signal cointegrator 1